MGRDRRRTPVVGPGKSARRRSRPGRPASTGVWVESSTTLRFPPMSPLDLAALRPSIPFRRRERGAGVKEASGRSDPVASAGLRLIEGPIGGCDQGRGVLAIAWEGGDAEADGHGFAWGG